jgi:hypothetical protein
MATLVLDEPDPDKIKLRMAWKCKKALRVQNSNEPNLPNTMLQPPIRA